MGVKNKILDGLKQKEAWLFFALCVLLALGTLGCQRQLAGALEEQDTSASQQLLRSAAGEQDASASQQVTQIVVEEQDLPVTQLEIDEQDERADDSIMLPAAITKKYYVTCTDSSGTQVVKNKGVNTFQAALNACSATYASNLIAINTPADSHYSIPADISITIQPKSSAISIEGTASSYEAWGEVYIYSTLDNRGTLLIQGRPTLCACGVGSESGGQESVDAAIYNYEEGTLTLDDIKVEGGVYGIVNCGTLNQVEDASSVTVDGTCTGLLNLGGTANICVGTIRGSEGPAIDAQGGAVTITGGYIISDQAPLISCASGASVYIPGTSTARFSSDASEFCQEGYKTAYDEDEGYYVVVEDIPVSSLLTVASTVGGLASGQGTYQEASQVTVTAQCQQSFNFSGWFVNSTPEDASNPTPTGDCLSTSLVYSFVMPGYALNLVAVFEPQPLAQANIRVLGESFTVQVGGANASKTSYTQSFEESIDVGTLVTIEYTGEESFYYWTNESQKIMGTASCYSFYVTSTTTLTAVTTNSQEAVFRVSYKSAYDRVIKFASCSKGSTVEPPSDPIKLGYEFSGWQINSQGTIYSSTEIASAIQAFILAVQSYQDLEISPCFTRVQGAYQLTIESYVDGVWSETQLLSLRQQGLLRMTAQEKEGYLFSCWKQGDQVISADASCLVYLRQNTTVKAYYVSQAQEAADPTPLLVVEDFFMTPGEGANRVTHISIHQVPEGYTTVAYGILFTTSASSATEENLCVAQGEVEGSGVQVRIQNQQKAHDSYAYTASFKEGSTTTLYLRAFLVYRDATGEQLELYSPIVSCNYSGILG